MLLKPSPPPLLLPLSLAVLAGLASCQKSKSSASSEHQIDACTLIPQQEVQVVQGAPVKEVKSNVSTNGGFRTADCLYTSEINDHSVSLALIQKNAGSPNARDPKEYWKTSFERYWKKPPADKDGAADEKEKGEGSGEHDEFNKNAPAPPQTVDGLGDAAFWASDFTGGSLYVLKGDVFIRIRFTGPESEASKIEMSKALATKALSRL